MKLTSALGAVRNVRASSTIPSNPASGAVQKMSPLATQRTGRRRRPNAGVGTVRSRVGRPHRRGASLRHHAAKRARELLDGVRLVQQIETVVVFAGEHVAVAGGEHHRQVGPALAQGLGEGHAAHVGAIVGEVVSASRTDLTVGQPVPFDDDVLTGRVHGAVGRARESQRDAHGLRRQRHRLANVQCAQALGEVGQHGVGAPSVHVDQQRDALVTVKWSSASHLLFGIQPLC